MKSKKQLITIISASVVLLTAACQKKDETPVQPDEITVNIVSPTNGQTVKYGDVLDINATVSYISQMHGYLVRIVDKDNGKVYYETEGHVHGDYFIVTEKWKDTVQHDVNLQLQLTAIIDHENNNKTEEVSFKSQPQ